MEFSKARHLVPALIIGLSLPTLATATSLSKSVAGDSSNGKAQCLKLVKNFAPANYVLVSRTLKDGKVLSGERITGSLSYSKNGYRTLAVAVDNRDGTMQSAGLQTRFKISPTQFTDTNVAGFFLANASPDKPMNYIFDPLTATLPVTCENGDLLIKAPKGGKFPADPVTEMQFTSKGMTATLVDGIVDHWKRVD